jgi:monovalent cation:H+ antiporter, CPA1 family
MHELKGATATVFSYATLGVLISIMFIRIFTKAVTGRFGYELDWVSCFLFGSLISPIDSIVFIDILSKYKIPQKLIIEIIEESLFNDGVGVFVVAVILSLITGGNEVFTFGNISKIFVLEKIGGLGIVFIVGYSGYLDIYSFFGDL